MDLGSGISTFTALLFMQYCKLLITGLLGVKELKAIYIYLEIFGLGGTKWPLRVFAKYLKNGLANLYETL